MAMSENNHREAALKRASELLGALLDEGMLGETRSKIQEWFVSDMSIDEKYDALRPIFETLEPNLNPDEYEYEMYRKVCKKLEFQGESEAKPKPKFTFGYFMKLAAIVLLPLAIVSGAAYFWLKNANRVEDIPVVASVVTVSVDKGKQKHIVLPDESEIWINSASTIRYTEDFLSDRSVYIDEGEAYFSVVNNTTPFYVKTNNLLVKVMGTEFNVKAYGGENTQEVHLVKGAVQLETSTGESIELKPSERLTFALSSQQFSVVAVDENIHSDWAVRDINFVNVPLGDALKQIAIYYERELELQNWKNTGDLVNLDHSQALSLEAILNTVSLITNGFAYQVTENKIIITIR